MRRYGNQFSAEFGIGGNLEGSRRQSGMIFDRDASGNPVVPLFFVVSNHTASPNLCKEVFGVDKTDAMVWNPYRRLS